MNVTILFLHSVAVIVTGIAVCAIAAIIVVADRRHRQRVKYRAIHDLCRQCSQPLRRHYMQYKLPPDASGTRLDGFLSREDYLSQTHGECTNPGCVMKSSPVLVAQSALKHWGPLSRFTRRKQLRIIIDPKQLIMDEHAHQILESRKCKIPHYPEGKPFLGDFFKFRRGSDTFHGVDLDPDLRHQQPK